MNAHSISVSDYRRYRADFNGALTQVKHLRLHGGELEAVVENLHDIAASGKLIPSRLPALLADASATASGGAAARSSRRPARRFAGSC